MQNKTNLITCTSMDSLYLKAIKEEDCFISQANLCSQHDMLGIIHLLNFEAGMSKLI